MKNTFLFVLFVLIMTCVIANAKRDTNDEMRQSSEAQEHSKRNTHSHGPKTNQSHAHDNSGASHRPKRQEIAYSNVPQSGAEQAEPDNQQQEGHHGKHRHHGGNHNHTRNG